MKTPLAVTLLFGFVAVGAYTEMRFHEGARHLVSTAIRPAAATFRSSPIPSDWVLAGNPVTEVAEVSETQDETAKVYLWRTTASTFRWTHRADEIITILKGDVFITEADGQRYHLTVGDVAHFPADSQQVWEVPHELLKSAILKQRSPQPVEAAQRWLRWARSFAEG